jgi:cobalamin-dependent methionine synthase I
VGDRLAAQLVHAAVTGDPVALEHGIRRALGHGSATKVFSDVLSPAMCEIGELWARGECSVVGEHLASVAIEGAVRTLLTLVAPADPRGRVLLACVDEEQHTLPLYGAALRFAQWGYEPIVLGQRTPPESLESAIRAAAADLVGLSVTVADMTNGAVARYAAAARGVPWLVGGNGAAKVAPAVEACGGYAMVMGGEEGWLDLGRWLARARRPKPSRPRRRRRPPKDAP